MREQEERAQGRLPGFRCWWGDRLVILVCVAATWLLWKPLGRLSLVLPVTLGHFFLFCNVFRVRRRHEMVWAAVFVANVAFWLLAGELCWLPVLALQTPLTVLLIVLDRRRLR